MQFLEAKARRIVIKIGTNSLAAPDGSLRQDRMRDLCRQVSTLRKEGFDVILISSGAVGLGVGRMGLPQRPAALPALQACAAIGQSCLMQAWQASLQERGLKAAQVLLTREDIRGRRRHLAVRETMETLLAFGCVPVVNENDTVSADEIKFGDNDVLSALVASLLKADLLIILSTIPGLMMDHGKGALIPVVTEFSPEIEAMAGGARDTNATGGMITKLEAAKLATQSGCGVFIGAADATDILLRIRDGSAEGTFFVPQALSMAARKRWIAFFEKPTGSLHLDEGAVRALVEQHSSLLAGGIRTCEGAFPEGAVVTLHGPDGARIGRGIVGYPSEQLNRIMGMDSRQIRDAFPGRSRVEVVHRDGMVLF